MSAWPCRTFEEYLEHSQQNFSVVREKGDEPWFENPERSAAMAARLGLPADTPALDLRKSLFERGRK